MNHPAKVEQVFVFEMELYDENRGAVDSCLNIPNTRVGNFPLQLMRYSQLLGRQLINSQDTLASLHSYRPHDWPSISGTQNFRSPCWSHRHRSNKRTERSSRRCIQSTNHRRGKSNNANRGVVNTHIRVHAIAHIVLHYGKSAMRFVIITYTNERRIMSC